MLNRGNRFKDLTNMTFGDLTARKIVGSSKNNTLIWLCDCSCGNVVEVKSTDLRILKRTHCGCKSSENRSKSNSYTNTYVTQGSITYGYDSRGNEFIIDTEDLSRVQQYYWGMNPRGYFVNSKHGLFLHRFILDTPKGLVVDHKNHNTGDNRKCNIWSCTQSDNMYNQLRFHFSNKLLLRRKSNGCKINTEAVLCT